MLQNIVSDPEQRMFATLSLSSTSATKSPRSEASAELELCEMIAVGFRHAARMRGSRRE